VHLGGDQMLAFLSPGAIVKAPRLSFVFTSAATVNKAAVSAAPKLRFALLVLRIAF